MPEFMRKKARPVAAELLPKIKEQLTKFEKQGYLKRIPIGQYGVALVVAKKPDGELRLCGDYRPINSHIKHMPLTMPDIHGSIQRLLGYKVFAELDWATAFHQIPLDEESAKRRAISTPFGLYAPQFVPEGIAVGSALLMQLVYTIFNEYDDWLVPIRDNLLIGATDADDLREKVKTVLRKCRENNIQLKISKSKFGVSKFKFFG